jgi:hypothetical protein
MDGAGLRQQLRRPPDEYLLPSRSLLQQPRQPRRRKSSKHPFRHSTKLRRPSRRSSKKKPPTNSRKKTTRIIQQQESTTSLFNDANTLTQPEQPDHLKDRTEIDLQLGNLFIEAKLTESNFQTASPRLIERYRDLETIFAIERLPSKLITSAPTHPPTEDFSDLEEPTTTKSPTPARSRTIIQGYQLIRNVLAAFASDASFCVLCDARRHDLIETWYSVLAAVHYPSFAWRLKLLTWQELTNTLPDELRIYLEAKYGILPG